MRTKLIVLKIFQQLQDPLFRNSIFLALSRIINISVGFFFWLAAARIYSVDDVGLTTALISSQSLITIFSLFGFDFSLIRFLPINNARKVYSTCLITTSILSLTIATAYISCIHLFSPNLIILQRPAAAAAFLLFTLLNTITLINGNTFLSFRKGGEFLVQNILLALRIPLLCRNGCCQSFRQQVFLQI